MELEDYLKQKHTPATAKRYQRDILIYQTEMPHHKTATYSEIMDYLGKLRKRYSNPESIKTILQGIKKYYSWLVATDQRNDHPCRYLHLKDKQNRSIQLQDLFTSKELELLLERKERYSELKIKNQVIIGLLIYQALTTGETTRLTLEEINLEQSEIYIKSSPKQNSRTLKLHPNQILPLHQYITAIRPELQKQETDKLILTKLGTPETGEGISYLVSTFKKLFPERNLNPKTIRQSVITSLLKAGNDLRVVQVFAGHKYPSATENYKQANVEQLKIEVLKYHPLQ